ncbi:hypothetical protein GCM10010169_16560 [Micromonospora fulviviridis]|nr:hypothetical protein GCM10010169_16560 [Micromonospora fulviviridis]
MVTEHHEFPEQTSSGVCTEAGVAEGLKKMAPVLETLDRGGEGLYRPVRCLSCHRYVGYQRVENFSAIVSGQNDTQLGAPIRSGRELKRQSLGTGDRRVPFRHRLGRGSRYPEEQHPPPARLLNGKEDLVLRTRVQATGNYAVGVVLGFERLPVLLVNSHSSESSSSS